MPSGGPNRHSCWCRAARARGVDLLLADQLVHAGAGDAAHALVLVPVLRVRAAGGRRAARARGIDLLAEQLLRAGARGAAHVLVPVLVLHTFADDGRAKRPTVMFFGNPS